MNIELAGRTAFLLGTVGTVAAAVEQALAENGAAIVRVEPTPAALDAAVAERGPPFLLVNASAGADGIPDPDRGDMAEFEAFAAATRRLAPHVKRVVGLVSSAGLVPVRGAAAFSAAQAGLVALTRTLAMELGPDVRVNAVAVGAYAADGAPANARFLTHTAVKRPARLSEIAAAALFLADPDNGYMTGHTLNIDGGWAIGYARNF